jgi:heterodisulfide reductase subunit A-like polyferredoxin
MLQGGFTSAGAATAAAAASQQVVHAATMKALARHALGDRGSSSCGKCVTVAHRSALNTNQKWAQPSPQSGRAVLS